MSKYQTEQRTFQVGAAPVVIGSSARKRRAITISPPDRGILYVSLGVPAAVGQGFPLFSVSEALTLSEETCGTNLQDYVSAVLLPTGPISPASNTDTPVAADSGDVAAAVATATLAGVAGQTTFLSGFTLTGTGATAGSTIRVTVTGVVGGPLGFDYVVPAGATTAAPTFQQAFNPPLAASAVNTAIVVSVPSFGAGNLHAEMTAWGFQRLAVAAGAQTPATVGVFDVLECVCEGEY